MSLLQRDKKQEGWMDAKCHREGCVRVRERARVCVCYFICKLMSNILSNSSLFREYLNATGLRCHDFSCGMHDIWMFL